MPFITTGIHWVIPILVFIVYALFFDGKRGRIALAVLILTLIVTDSVASQIIKPWVGRIRPSHAMADTIHLLVSRGGRFSFVSNHAANSMALAIVLGYFYPRFRHALVLLAGVIAFSRVYVGVHYPADVLAGTLFGGLMGGLGLSLWVLVKMRELKRGRTWVWYSADPPPLI